MNTLSCRNQPIRIHKPHGHGVIIPAQEVIQSRLGIILIPTVAEGVELAHGRGQSAGDADRAAPRVVAVLHHRRAGFVNQPHHVALRVVDVVIPRTVQQEADPAAVALVQEEQDIIALLHLHDLAVGVPPVGGRRAVHGFLHPPAVRVVLERHAQSGFVQRFELPAVPRHRHPVPVGEGVADLVVGNALSLVGGQQVLPDAVSIGEGREPGHAGLQITAHGIGVFLLAHHIAARVVGVGEHLARDLVVLPDQLVQPVVPVGDLPAVLVCDGCNVPVVVVGVIPVPFLLRRTVQPRLGNIAVDQGGGSLTAHPDKGELSPHHCRPQLHVRPILPPKAVVYPRDPCAVEQVGCTLAGIRAVGIGVLIGLPVENVAFAGEAVLVVVLVPHGGNAAGVGNGVAGLQPPGHVVLVVVDSAERLVVGDGQRAVRVILVPQDVIGGILRFHHQPELPVFVVAVMPRVPVAVGCELQLSAVRPVGVADELADGLGRAYFHKICPS